MDFLCVLPLWVEKEYSNDVAKKEEGILAFKLSLMLKKENRLSRKNFPSQLSRGVSFHSKNITLRFIKENKSPSVFSVVISKKVDKRSTKRNVLRRAIYEIIRKNMKNTQTLGSYVFFLKKTALSQNKEGLKEEVLELLKKAEY